MPCHLSFVLIATLTGVGCVQAEKRGWGFSSTFLNVSKAVSSAAQATMEVASRDLTELQNRVRQRVVAWVGSLIINVPMSV